MQPEWLFYQEPNRAVFFNFNYFASAPLLHCPELLCLRLSLHSVSSGTTYNPAEEQQSLFAWEDKLFFFAEQGLKGHYVGRITEFQNRFFFIYYPALPFMPAALDKLAKSLPKHDLAYFSEPDPDWQTYFEQLCPDRLQLRRLLNTETYKKLSGKDGTTNNYFEPGQMVTLQHTCSFATARLRVDFVQGLSLLFPQASELYYFNAKLRKSPFAIRYSLSCAWVAAALDAQALEFEKLSWDGVYWGWEPLLIKSKCK